VGIARDARLQLFLQANRHGERYLLATLNARMAAPVIIETGQPVMALGGFMGADPILTPERLSAMVAAGELRFVLLGGDFFRRAGGDLPQRPIVEWIKANGAAVDAALWRSAPLRAPGQGQGQARYAAPELYDLRPSAGFVRADGGSP
jgi:4-amino-4-deoxy-L-arabinose transferase-like glycosyltransferase